MCICELASTDTLNLAQPDVQISMTILAYQYGGLRRKNIKSLLDRLKNDLKVEVGDMTKRATYEKFHSIVVHAIRARLELSAETTSEAVLLDKWKSLYGEPPNLELVAPNDPADVQTVFELLQHSRPTIAEFLLAEAFAETMQQHPRKISSSAQELGGSIVFGRRLGFSGTPSNLLPRGLGSCQFDKESEGRILRTLTDPLIVNESLLCRASEGSGQAAAGSAQQRWTSFTILDAIAAGRGETKYHALIDTGALVTGLSNEQVARYLLEGSLHANEDGRESGEGGGGGRLEGFDACVFLDDRDRKIVMRRGAPQTFPLSEYGGSKDRMFTFFDQVHLTLPFGSSSDCHSVCDQGWAVAGPHDGDGHQASLGRAGPSDDRERHDIS